MKTEPEPDDSLKSLRSFCAALEERFQTLKNARDGQDALLERSLREQAESAKQLSALAEICRSQVSEVKELRKELQESRLERRTLITTIRRLAANLEALLRRSDGK